MVIEFVLIQEAAVREGRQIGSRPTNSGGVLVVGGSGSAAAGSKEGELNTAANCDFRSGEAVAMCGWDNLANSTVLRFSHFYPPKFRVIFLAGTD
jgi:hypothetical protein